MARFSLASWWSRIRAMGWKEFVLLVSVAAVCLGVAVFAGVTETVAEGEYHEAEKRLMQSLRRADDPSVPVGPRWLRHVSLDISALGGGAVLTLMTLVVLGYLALERRWHAMIFLVIAALGGMGLNRAMKAFFGRERPDIVPHLSEVSSASYPSGHSMLSSIIYLALGVMLARSVPSRRLKVYVIAVALGLSFLVGLSRIHLGVHYPTDVIAGWAAGTTYAVLCALAAYWLQMRGLVERPATPTS